jgi:hypothetical protein
MPLLFSIVGSLPVEKLLHWTVKTFSAPVFT